MPSPVPPCCPLCDVPSDRVVAQSVHTLTLRDAHPVSPGHTLIVPKRHVASFFELSDDDLADVLSALRAAKSALDAELRPDGYNVGVNVGAAAGQTVMHAHVHVIPRFAGDTADPRGGVRHCIPGKGYYEPNP